MEFPGYRVPSCHKRPAPIGGRAGERGAISSLKEFSRPILLSLPYASAGTESAQVSTFARIALSEYEVRVSRPRLIVTM